MRVRHDWKCAGWSVTVAAAVACFALPASSQVTVSFTEPLERIDVSAAEFGLIQSVRVREGQQVDVETLLGTLDDRVLKESRRLAEQRSNSTARIEAARADCQLKKSHYDKLAPLLREGHANHSEIERAKTEHAGALAALRLAEEESIEAKIELDRIDAQLAQREIRSPIQGTVVEVHRRPGEYLASNDPRFATIVQLDQLRARFFIETDAAIKLEKGSLVPIRVKNVEDVVLAVVEFVSPITDSQSGTVRVDVLIDNKNQEYRSGIACEILIGEESTASGRTVILPTAAEGGSITRGSLHEGQPQ